MRLLKTIFAFAVLAFATACGSGDYQLCVIFDNVEGLKENAEVLVNGLEVGKVENMALVRNGVAVTMSIDDKHKIPAGSQFDLESPSFLGDRHVIVKAGNGKGILKDGDTIQGARHQNSDRQLTIRDLDSLAVKYIKTLRDSTKAAQAEIR